MNLLVTCCNFRNTPIDIREKFSFDGSRLKAALDWFSANSNVEVVILATCNRVEIYIAGIDSLDVIGREIVRRFLSEFFEVPGDVVEKNFFFKNALDAVKHLFRVSASLDSMIVGEGQIAGQVKSALETASSSSTAGPLLYSLFRQARRVAKRVRTETLISRGNISVSSVAVGYVKQVFDHFGDKVVAILGAGKMGELTLKSLQELNPRNIIVANRSPEKSAALAQACNGEVYTWDRLADVLLDADIIISSTGSREPIVSKEFYSSVSHKRNGRSLVILDIAVPRDFDPEIHDGDQTCLFNIDDLQKIRESTLKERLKHVPQAENIVEQESSRFLADWERRRNGPVIARLNQEFENKRRTVVSNLLSKLNGKLSKEDKDYIEGAFRLLQNQFLHGPISALAEEMQKGNSSNHSLIDALRKLFRLQD
ncbi:MAG: glutamyl-tRNA reductase [Gemmataceae bacterium]